MEAKQLDLLFFGQFIISQNLQNIPQTWNTFHLQEWQITTHPNLPVIPLQTNNEDCAGWIVGFPINSNGELIEVTQFLPCQNLDDLTANGIEDYLYSFGGRFICVVITQNLRRLYLDPCGSLAVVYSTTKHCIASTTSLLKYAENSSIDFQNISTQFLKPNRFYPAGLTIFPELQRLLPNYYLDLEYWKPVRHWLQKPLSRVPHRQIAEQIEIIAHHVQNNLRGVTQKYHSYMGITSGRDSRMILACSRELHRKMTFFTFDYPDSASGRYADAVDVYMGCKISQNFALNHLVLPIQTPTEILKQEYFLRIGYSGHWGKIKDYEACCKHLELQNALLIGFAGEVGRGYYWPKEKNKSWIDSPKELLSIMHLPVYLKFCEAIEDWLTDISVTDVYMLLDILYLEQRVGCWASPHLYGMAPFKIVLMPFNHRKILEAMIRLPVEYKRSQGLADDIVNFMWPELSGRPYQRRSGFSGYVSHNLHNGKQILEKALRKILSYTNLHS